MSISFVDKITFLFNGGKGIGGGQIEDGTVPEGALDTAAQAKLNSLGTGGVSTGVFDAALSRVDDDIGDLQHLTRDLHVLDLPNAWGDYSDASKFGLALVTGNPTGAETYASEVTLSQRADTSAASTDYKIIAKVADDLDIDNLAVFLSGDNARFQGRDRFNGAIVLGTVIVSGFRFWQVDVINDDEEVVATAQSQTAQDRTRYDGEINPPEGTITEGMLAAAVTAKLNAADHNTEIIEGNQDLRSFFRRPDAGTSLIRVGVRFFDSWSGRNSDRPSDHQTGEFRLSSYAISGSNAQQGSRLEFIYEALSGEAAGNIYTMAHTANAQFPTTPSSMRWTKAHEGGAEAYDDLTVVDPTVADHVLLYDASDSHNKKRSQLSSVSLIVLDEIEGSDIEFTGSNGFSQPVEVAAPTADPHAATKKYVDDNAGGGAQLEVLGADPSVDAYQVDDIVVVNDQWRRLALTDETDANIFAGTRPADRVDLNGRARGIRPGHGRWTANPNDAIRQVWAYSNGLVNLDIKKTEYETAKGSAVVAGDQIGFVGTIASVADSNVTVALNFYLTYDHTYRDNGVEILQFARQFGIASAIYTAAGDQNLVFEITEAANDTVDDSTPLLTHNAGLKHWIDWHDRDFDILLDEVDEVRAELAGVNDASETANTKLQERITDLLLHGGEYVHALPAAAADSPTELLVTADYDVDVVVDNSRSAALDAISRTYNLAIEAGAYKPVDAGAAASGHNRIRFRIDRNDTAQDHHQLWGFNWNGTHGEGYSQDFGERFINPYNACSAFVFWYNTNTTYGGWNVLLKHEIVTRWQQATGDNDVLHQLNAVITEADGTETTLPISAALDQSGQPATAGGRFFLYGARSDTFNTVLRRLYNAHGSGSDADKAARTVDVRFRLRGSNKDLWLGDSRYSWLRTFRSSNDVPSGSRFVRSTAISTIWTGTKAQYDAITTKDPSTHYFVEDEKKLYRGSTEVLSSGGGLSPSQIGSGWLTASANYSDTQVDLDDVGEMFGVVARASATNAQSDMRFVLKSALPTESINSDPDRNQAPKPIVVHAITANDRDLEFAKDVNGNIIVAANTSTIQYRLYKL